MRSILFFSALSLFFYDPLSAQLTLKVTSIPAATPPNATIYVAGTMNNWSPGNAAYTLAPDGNGAYKITLNIPAGQVKFKFTRGAWASVEGDANGNFRPDRVINYSGQATTETLSILSWEDLGGGSGNNSTAAANVQIMDEDFYIPQLNRNRRIWLYLPPDYANTNKYYPVLYMHDGQNLFDNETAPFGEWRVDETLNTLHQQGDFGCIVVGIDHGGVDRLNEYSPWVNTQYGGGQGDEYIDFIVNTLKPYIDQNYRTRPGRISTGIMGSSMGGLISMYALSEHQDVFSRAGVLSPAFWFAGSSPANHVKNHPKEGDARVYFLAGGEEPQYVADDMLEVSSAMTTAGFSSSEKDYNVVSGGQHSEWFWAQEFGEAYQWLFANVVSTTEVKAAKLSVWPNPADSSIQLSGFQGSASVKMQIISAENRIVRNFKHRPGEAIDVSDLQKGFYFIKATGTKGKTYIARFLKM